MTSGAGRLIAGPASGQDELAGHAIRFGRRAIHSWKRPGSTDAPFGFSVSSKFQIESPLYQVAFRDTSVPFERTVVGSFRDGNGSRWGRRQLDMAITRYAPLSFIGDGTELRFRVDIINVLNDRNYTEFNNNPGDTSRDDGSSTVYGERIGYSVGGNPPRTVKLSAGFSF